MERVRELTVFYDAIKND